MFYVGTRRGTIRGSRGIRVICRKNKAVGSTGTSVSMQVIQCFSLRSVLQNKTLSRNVVWTAASVQDLRWTHDTNKKNPRRRALYGKRPFGC